MSDDPSKILRSTLPQVFPESPDAARNFEHALIGLREARDSRGLKIRLYCGTSYTAEGFRDALRELTSLPFSADRVRYLNNFQGDEDPNGELTFARHLQLLSNCYVAALEYERTARR